MFRLILPLVLVFSSLQAQENDAGDAQKPANNEKFESQIQEYVKRAKQVGAEEEMSFLLVSRLIQYFDLSEEAQRKTLQELENTGDVKTLSLLHSRYIREARKREALFTNLEKELKGLLWSNVEKLKTIEVSKLEMETAKFLLANTPLNVDKEERLKFYKQCRKKLLKREPLLVQRYKWAAELEVMDFAERGDVLGMVTVERSIKDTKWGLTEQVQGIVLKQKVDYTAEQLEKVKPSAGLVHKIIYRIAVHEEKKLDIFKVWYPLYTKAIPKLTKARAGKMVPWASDLCENLREAGLNEMADKLLVDVYWQSGSRYANRHEVHAQYFTLLGKNKYALERGELYPKELRNAYYDSSVAELYVANGEYEKALPLLELKKNETLYRRLLIHSEEWQRLRRWNYQSTWAKKESRYKDPHDCMYRYYHSLETSSGESIEPLSPYRYGNEFFLLLAGDTDRALNMYAERMATTGWLHEMMPIAAECNVLMLSKKVIERSLKQEKPVPVGALESYLRHRKYFPESDEELKTFLLKIYESPKCYYYHGNPGKQESIYGHKILIARYMLELGEDELVKQWIAKMKRSGMKDDQVGGYYKMHLDRMAKYFRGEKLQGFNYDLEAEKFFSRYQKTFWNGVGRNCVFHKWEKKWSKERAKEVKAELLRHALQKMEDGNLSDLDVSFLSQYPDEEFVREAVVPIIKHFLFHLNSGLHRVNRQICRNIIYLARYGEAEESLRLIRLWIDIELQKSQLLDRTNIMLVQTYREILVYLAMERKDKKQLYTAIREFQRLHPYRIDLQLESWELLKGTEEAEKLDKAVKLFWGELIKNHPKVDVYPYALKKWNEGVKR